MLLGDPCTYVIHIINITVYLMLLLLELKTCLKAFKEYFLSELIIINFGIHFYTRHVYRFKISVIGLLDL